jgi:transcription initiation factor TFIIF subunit beta
MLTQFLERTAIAGKVAHEVNCIAVINQESERILGQRTLDAMKPKRFTKFLNEDLSALSSGFIQPGTIHAQNTFTDFIVCILVWFSGIVSNTLQKTKNPSSGPRPQLTKTARMPENELMDRIFGCFRRYNYWSMKALRAELQQPEAYLREVLERVAVLAKSGRFATQWSLKQEYKAKNYEGMDDAVAPMAEGAGAEESDMADEEDGDDDEDVKFEDVA